MHIAVYRCWSAWQPGCAHGARYPHAHAQQRQLSRAIVRGNTTKTSTAAHAAVECRLVGDLKIKPFTGLGSSIISTWLTMKASGRKSKSKNTALAAQLPARRPASGHPRSRWPQSWLIPPRRYDPTPGDDAPRPPPAAVAPRPAARRRRLDRRRRCGGPSRSGGAQDLRRHLALPRWHHLPALHHQRDCCLQLQRFYHVRQLRELRRPDDLPLDGGREGAARALHLRQRHHAVLSRRRDRAPARVLPGRRGRQLRASESLSPLCCSSSSGCANFVF